MLDALFVTGVMRVPYPVREQRVHAEAQEPFIGRAATCRLLDAQVASAAGGGSASLIVGEPGIGKTALLHRLARHSRVRTCWVRGTETEAAMPYASAADLLTPLKAHLPALPAVQARALEVALALSDGPPVSDLAVCTGALGLLAAAGEEAPLVAFVDDLHWVDAESRQLLLFVARRLVAEHVVLIFAAREDPGARPPSGDLPTLRLPALTVAECAELVVAHGLQATAGQVHEVARATGGNPLAVLESLGPAGTVDVGAQEGVASIRPTVQTAWRAVLLGLPDATRRALFLLASVEGPGLPSPLELLPDLGLDVADLAPAEAQGLIRYRSGTAELRHPLLRQVLVDSTSLSVRLATYRALAARAAPDQQPWFLSFSTLGPNEQIAARLVASADDARARAAHGAAARLLRRAAELTVDDGARAERLLAAASAALLAGNCADAELWCGEVLVLAQDGRLLARATSVRGAALTWMGYPRRARDELVRAAATIRMAAPADAAGLLCAAAQPAAMAGDVRGSAQLAADSLRLFEEAGAQPPFRALALSAAAGLMAADGAGTQELLDRARWALSSADPLLDQHAVVAMALCHLWSERLDEAQRLVDEAVEAARGLGGSHVLAYALAVRADLATRAGDWPGAYADASESLRWAQEKQQLATAGYALVCLAWIDAARGELDLMEERLARLRREAGARIDAFVTYEAAVLGLAALSDDDPEAAVGHYELAWRQGERHGHLSPGVVPFVADMAEARIRCGRASDAERPLAWLEAGAEARGLVQPLVGVHRCRGLMAADPARALQEFARSRDAAERCALPFELARAWMAEGELLRRTRSTLGARRALREARRLFEGLGARPWAERATRELAAAGERGMQASTRAALADLTPQELQVARMVAGGRNNAEAAAALFVSRKTVEAHLTRVYRKLQVTSRSQLTALVVTGGLRD